MWFLFFFIAIPFILFIGFLVFSIFAIFLINRIFHKKYSQSFSLILPCFSLIFYFILIMGGISFKSIDPQYYEFKRLCVAYAGKTFVGDKPPKNFVYGDHFIRKQLTSRIVETAFELKSNNEIVFFKNNTYFYDNYGIFLKGDEGAGWHIKFGSEVLDCEYIDKRLKSIL